MKPYIGRFAPSPTGHLHFGSLLAALASYLDAKAHHGQWLLRIEDLDPPREVAGAAQHIIETLTLFGFEWDGAIEYQSQRHALYQARLQQLLDDKHAYRCHCSRKQLAQRDALHHYDRYCLTHPPAPQDICAVRVQDCQPACGFQDRIQPDYLQEAAGDFVIFRRDGFFAYHLAVVCDDIAQGVNQIVRGADLFHETIRHLVLYHWLGEPAPQYAHIPIVTNAAGQKLSKQTFARELDNAPAARTQQLCQALAFLNQPVPPELHDATPQELLAYAVKHWQIAQVPRCYAQPMLDKSAT